MRMVPSDGVQLPQRHSWLSTQRMVGRRRQAVPLRQGLGPGGQVDGVACGPAFHAAHHLGDPAFLVGGGHAGRDGDPQHAADLPRLHRLAPPGAANDLDLHSSGRYRDPGTSTGRLHGCPFARVRLRRLAGPSTQVDTGCTEKDRPRCASPNSRPGARRGTRPVRRRAPVPAPPLRGRRPASVRAPAARSCGCRPAGRPPPPGRRSRCGSLLRVG